MLDLTYPWDPNEWECHVQRLLQDQYSFLDVDPIPAAHRGDFGIDYYCKRFGAVFQCYAVQEPVTTADRAAKQQGKINDDIKKFCSDTKALKKLLGPVKISDWVLVVPFHNSAQVVAHATTVTQQVVAKNLTYVAPNFKVAVRGLDSFSTASRQKFIQELNQVIIPIKEATEQDILDWRNTSAIELLSNLTRKLQKRTMSPSSLDSDVDLFIKMFLDKENAIDYLRNEAPQLHEIVTKAINQKLNRLRMEGLRTEGTANLVLREEIESLEAILTSKIHNLSSISSDAIVHGTVGEWLIRCPLDFPPYQS
jgi:hypothetical protein